MHISTNDLKCCKPARLLQLAPSGGLPLLCPSATAPPRTPHLTNRDRLPWKTDGLPTANCPPTTAPQQRHHNVSTPARGPPTRPSTPSPSPQQLSQPSQSQGQGPISEQNPSWPDLQSTRRTLGSPSGSTQVVCATREPVLLPVGPRTGVCVRHPFCYPFPNQLGTCVHGCQTRGWTPHLCVGLRGVQFACAGHPDQIVTCCQCRIHWQAEGNCACLLLQYLFEHYYKVVRVGGGG
jgi:hypothetical protein